MEMDPKFKQPKIGQSGSDYQGPERRKFQRRQSEDRREGIRLELDKPPRRSGKDRRSHEYLWNQPHSL
jgi:hypothetical protein